MSYDFFMEIWKETSYNSGKINFNNFKNRINKLESNFMRIKLISMGIFNKKTKDTLKNYYKEEIKIYNKYITKQSKIMDDILSVQLIESDDIPNASFFLSTEFDLKKPYISRDDEEFYIHENPVSKEKVFKIPYIRPSSWKGMIRWAALMNLLKNMKEKKNRGECLTRRSQIIRIFGNEKENRENRIFEELFPEKLLGTNENKFNHDFLEYIIKKNYVNKDGLGKGRLYFYPTFFGKISLDIINPHDREIRIGRNPITMEIVPEGKNRCLKLLYFPFDLLGEDKEIVKKEMKEDLLIICNALKLLFEEYGISAKRTSGYGAAEITKVTFESKALSELRDIADLDQLIKKIKSSGGD